jgi:hypothetical protein
MTSSILFLNGNPLFFFLILIALLIVLTPVQKCCYLNKEIFEKKNNKVGKNKFYKEEKQVKNCVSKYLKLWN